MLGDRMGDATMAGRKLTDDEKRKAQEYALKRREELKRHKT
jgi:hypothetical protein